MAPLHSSSPEGRLYLVGKNVTHTIAPQMHNFIAQQQLSLPWAFEAKECETVEEILVTFKSSQFVGGVVTMPYKTTVMSHLDELDPIAVQLNACNGVYLTPEGKLRGTNTDWRGVKGCLHSASSQGMGKPACIIGAGGASRAAVYALWAELGCSIIYIINRDQHEVEALQADVARMAQLRAADGSPREAPAIIHLQSVTQAESISEKPYYIVATVPDFEPSTPSEILSRTMLETLLKDAPIKGVFLDMCFKPRVTRQIKLAQKHDWKVVEGTEIIGHQIEQQWWLWTGQKHRLSLEEQKQAWAVLRSAAESSSAINF